MEIKEVHRFYLLHSQIGKLFGTSPTLSDFFEGNVISATPSHKLSGKIHPTSSDKMIVPSSISATLSPKSEKMHEGDNPPVDILLCTRKGKSSYKTKCRICMSKICRNEKKIWLRT